MSLTDELDAFSSLAEAVGLTEDGELKGAWFEDPLGTPNGSTRGLSSIMYTDAQRDALLAFVDDVLGPPDRETEDDAVWVPLFADSGATVFSVVETVAGAARVGFGIEYASGTSTPSVAVRAHVPVFQFPREGGGALDISGSQPDWLLLGRNGGCIELSLDVNISNDTPVAGELFLGGTFLSASIPTTASDTFSLGVGLRRLQLPGTTTPRDLDLNVDSLDELGSEVLEFLAGLIQAQAEALNPAESTTAPFAALSALLGLRSVPGIPGFPLEDLFTNGTSALIEWLESIFDDNTSRDAWLGEFAKLFGGTTNAARDSIEFTAGAVTGSVGLRTAAATGGGIKITPWVEVALHSRNGAEVRVTADALTADTTTGNVTALPAMAATAVFGREAGSSTDLLVGDPGIGSIRIGVALIGGQPAFALTAHNVTLGGTDHTVLDLSSPEAALDAASSLVDTALLNALTDLGRPGELAAILIGLDPPTGITALSSADVLTDPLGAVRDYWAALIANSAAFADVLKAARELITGLTTALTGAGTESNPWIIDIDPVDLLVWIDGNEIVVDLSANVMTPILDDFEAVAGVRTRIARLDVVNPAARFFSKFAGSLAIRRTDRATARFDLGPADLLADSFGTEVAWSARGGLALALLAPGLALELEGIEGSELDLPAVNIPIPVFNSDGSVTFAPDWDQIEMAVATLLGRAASPVIDVLLDLTGWAGGGARLRLAELIVDPEAAIRSWLGDLVLDCDNVRIALGPLSYLLSGFRLSTPLGSGNERDPFRAAIAGEPQAPGLSAWFDPGCALPLHRYEPAPGYFDEAEPPEEGVLVAALRDAARALPDIRDLLTSRDSLVEGLRSLGERMVGTDGLIGQPVALPDGVTGIDLNGYSYRELVALGAIDAVALEVFEAEPGAIVYVGCEDLWADNFGADSIDARTSTPTQTVAATADGTWSVALPLPADAEADRPDRGAVGEQAARLIAALAGRTAPITVVAFGAAGAAGIAAASTATSVERVVTVGCPWGPLAIAGFTSGLSADALRFLEQVRRPLDNEISEELLAGEVGPMIQMGHVIDRAVTAAGFGETALGDIPDASAQTRRAGLAIDAVFGLLNADEVGFGLASLISDSVAYRYELHEDPPRPPDALHVGVDLPVIDLNLGGVLVGAGATLELVSFDRGATGDSFEIRDDQQVILDLHFGVHDGWLVGGPGALQSDVEVRWMSARIHLPLGASTKPASTELVFHEASCFGVQRERWVVEIGADGVAATLPTSEVHIIMSEVITRLSAASADLGQLLADVGLIRAGGYDPQGLDRLVFDTATTIGDALDDDAAGLAGVLRRLTGFGGTGTGIEWTIDAATVAVDLQTRTIDIDLSHAPADLPAMGMSIALSASGLSVDGTLGAIDPVTGGLQLKASRDTATLSNNELSVCWQLPGASAPSTIGLLPLSEIDDLIKLTASLVPATLIMSFLDMMRTRVEEDARVAIDDLLDGLDLLGPEPEFGQRRILVPWALFLAPGAWLRYAASAWVADPLGQAVATLEALVPLVAPARIGPGWPLTDDVSLTYAVVSGRLSLGVDVAVSHTLDTAALRASIAGGISIDTSGAVSPLLSSSVTFDDRGLALAITPTVRLDLLRPSPVTPLQIYPVGPGIGSLIGAGATMAIPVALNALIAERNNASASLHRDVARVVFDVGGALDLLDADLFAEAKITAFAVDPVSGLTSHLPALAGAGIANLTSALDPAGTLVTATGEGAGRTRLDFGVTSAVSVTFDGGSSGPAIEFAGEIDIDDVGVLTIDEVRLGDNGVQVSTHFIADGLDVGNGLELMPVVTVRAGATSTGFDRLIGIGLATDGIGDRSVEFRWDLDSLPPRAVVVSRSGSTETEDSDSEDVALALLSLATSMAVSVTLDALDPVGSTVVDVLQNVAFTGGTAALDPQLFADFSDPDALLHRAYELAFNLADEDIKITIEGKVDVGFTKTGNRAGVFVSLTPGERVALGSGDPTVDLEIVSNWIATPGVAPGLSVFLIEKVGGNFNLNASVALAGLGVRVAKTAGPLLDLGIMAIDAIAVHVYGEAAPAAIGAGVHLQLDGLAFIPSAASGDNAVANNIMSDAADSASPSTRPAFSPSLAVQKAPAGDVGVTLRAGEPPGPWWVAIQRQLGPLYLEQFGFNVTEASGSVTGISLLFDARISLFGLNAEVDQLGLHWLGGDVFDLYNWAVDLQGLAVSGDFTGISISGGLLKTDLDGSIGYVGMLMGRFGVYGLSLFGGYSDDKGLPSFFVFGAIVGPIGGPPAFFVTGIGGGLGIKRGLRVPDDLSKFGEYPFIKALDPAASASQSPLEELRQLAEYFPPEAGNIWFAAGISFTSFALVDGVAVVSVSFGNGLEINLFGLARLALPRPQAALVSIELGLLARFSTAEGLFLIQAQLTDNSWLLYPEVRLTGGFAFATWWKGENAGQFVLTLGGYHPSFSRNGYPVVPRLGLEWRVTNDIVIKGGSYFALTSEALMAGVEIEVSADFGFVWAKIAFGANAIVYFDPFYFMADAYARISAGLKIKTFFGTIRISISIGARIEVEGPSFHGKAAIEIGPCDITVRFGDRHSERGTYVDWSGFVPKYLEQAAQGRASAISAVTGKGSLPAATDGNTSAPSSDGSAARPFEVFAEFEMAVVTTVPTIRFDFGSAGGSKTVTPKLPNGTTVGLGLSPMNASDLTSTLAFKLEIKAGSTWTDRTADLAHLVKNMVRDTAVTEGPTFGVEAFPIGVWGLPEDTEQPSSPVPKGDVIFAGSRLKLVAIASLDGPAGPEIDYYRVESGRRPLPLSATGSSRNNLLAEASALGVVEVATTTAAALALAETHLFSDRPNASVHGLISQGQRSATARASYVRSRTAPPLFGTLAEGLAPLNDKRGETTKMPAASAPTAKVPRAPFVTGYMVGGAGVGARIDATTVADGRIKRRPAPSLDSVRGRIGRSLPIKLTATAAPPVLGDATVIVRGKVPRTDLSGVARSYRGGHVGSTVGGVLVEGLSSRVSPRASGRRNRPRALEPGSRLRAGDVVTLRLPDAAIDLGDERPSLTVDGNARVVMLKGNGFVVGDRVVSDDTIEVAPCTAIVAVHANGGAGDIGSTGGIKVLGWHDQSRVARLGGRSAIASGCVINVEGATGRSRVGWAVAGDVVRGAAAVVTRFESAVRTVGVIVRSTDAQRLEDFGIELHGATRVTAAGKPVAPVIVQAGARSIMLFEVDPDSERAEIFVRATAGGTRQIAGVLGSAAHVDDLADLVAERGVIAVVARLRAASGDGCSLKWDGLAQPVSPGGPPTGATPSTGSATSAGVAQPGTRSRSVRKKTAKKTPAKKGTTRKGTAKKSKAKKAAAKKRTAKRMNGEH